VSVASDLDTAVGVHLDVTVVLRYLEYAAARERPPGSVEEIVQRVGVDYVVQRRREVSRLDALALADGSYEGNTRRVCLVELSDDRIATEIVLN